MSLCAELNLEMSRFGGWLETLATIGKLSQFDPSIGKQINLIDHTKHWNHSDNNWWPSNEFDQSHKSFISFKVHGSGSYCIHGIIPDCVWRLGWKEHPGKHCNWWYLHLPWGLPNCTPGLCQDWLELCSLKNLSCVYLSFIYFSTNVIGCCYWSRRLCFWGWWVRVKSLFWKLNIN